jgi:hypothetical protein
VSQIIYLAELNLLDADYATFTCSNPQDGTVNGTLTVRRSDWESQHRPSRISVTVSEESR